VDSSTREKPESGHPGLFRRTENPFVNLTRTCTTSIFDTTILLTLWLPSTIVAKIDVRDASVRGFRWSHEKGRDGRSQASLC